MALAGPSSVGAVEGPWVTLENEVSLTLLAQLAGSSEFTEDIARLCGSAVLSMVQAARACALGDGTAAETQPEEGDS